ncbi:MAG: hypothetical protein AABY83_03455 [Pseudomonadota bacterium]
MPLAPELALGAGLEELGRGDAAGLAGIGLGVLPTLAVTGVGAGALGAGFSAAGAALGLLTTLVRAGVLVAVLAATDALLALDLVGVDFTIVSLAVALVGLVGLALGGGDFLAAGLEGDDLPPALAGPLAGLLDLGFLTTIRVLLHHEVKVKLTFLPKSNLHDK